MLKRMPLSGEAKKEYNAEYYQRNVARKKLISAVRNVVAGRKPEHKTLQAFEWTEREVNRLRALDKRFAAVLEDKHGVSILRLFEGKNPLPPINLPKVQVKEVAPPPERPEGYEQGLEDTPKSGLDVPISWLQIETFWSGPVDLNRMGSTSALKEMRNGKLVARQYAKSTRQGIQRTFRLLREKYAKAEPKDNAVETLRDVKKWTAWLRDYRRKSVEQVEADATRTGSVGAVAGQDDEEGEEISSGPPLTSIAQRQGRARDKSEALKKVTQTYSKDLGHVASTYWSWKAFRDSMGSDWIQDLTGGFGERETGLLQAIQADREVQANKPKNPLHAVPSLQMLERYLPKIKEKQGPSTTWLAALLQVKLIGIRDNLGGIFVRTTDGRRFDPAVGDSSREDWYNRSTGRLYISHFKTGKSRFGTPYEFDVDRAPEVKRAIEETLAEDHPEAKREFLVGIGLKKDGLPAPAGAKVKKAFQSAGLVFTRMNKGKPIKTSPGPLDIRHAQVTDRHREMSRQNPRLTATQISERIAGEFNHASDVNIGYLRMTFDSVDSPLATKSSLFRRGSTDVGRVDDDFEPLRQALAIVPEDVEESSGNTAPTRKAPRRPRRKPSPGPPRRTKRTPKPTQRAKESKAQARRGRAK